MIKSMTWMLVLGAIAAGCGETKTEPAASHLSGLPASVVATAEPSGARDVAEVKVNGKEGDVVTVRGVVGGDVKPIVGGLAVFTIGDVKGLSLCTGPGETCKTPWDACCMEPAAKAANTLTVEVLGADGRPLAADVGASGVKPMATVVVTGKIGPRPDPKVLVVDATSVFVVKP
jgi:hypothetical protein